MNEGDVVLSSFRQADGQMKNRPAVVRRKMPPFGDILVCGVSRQLRHRVEGLDEIVATTDIDFPSSALVGISLIRPGFLALLPANEILGVIGSISDERHRRLLRNLADYLTRPPVPPSSTR